MKKENVEALERLVRPEVYRDALKIIKGFEEDV